VSMCTPVCMATYCAFTGRMMTLFQLAIFIPQMLLVIGVPMSVCLHRYFSHKAFETSRPMQFVIGLVATLAWQGGPLWWAMMHIRHHQHCDKPQDPHSAKQRGTTYAFIGWMGNPINYLKENIDYRFLDESLKVPEMFLLEKLHPIPPLLLCLVANHYIGYQKMVFSVLGPMLFSRFTTLIFNVHFHPEEHESRCKAVDDDRILAVLVGESNHKDHHSRPRRAHRLDLDIPWWITLSWMEATGLIWDCK
jgi:stearoyl-CoA desaturase (delta-9 desaturase)